jgi:hypothetical protein
MQNIAIDPCDETRAKQSLPFCGQIVGYERYPAIAAEIAASGLFMAGGIVMWCFFYLGPCHGLVRAKHAPTWILIISHLW